MRKRTDIWLYIIVCLMCVALLLAIAIAISAIVNPPNEYERGYMDGLRNGILIHDIDYGTIKLEGGEE